MKSVLSVIAVAIVCAGCGEPVAPTTSTFLLPPGGLAALSVDSTHVRLNWTAPGIASDTTFRGYVLAWVGVVDTLSKSTLQFTAGPLPHSAMTFSVRSLLKDGRTSDPVLITWAPAWRFDAVPIIMTEYNPPLQTGSPGMSAGTSTSNPAAVGMFDSNTGSLLDFYLYGLSNDTLHILSACLFNTAFHLTLFSTTATSSPDLNAPLDSFPADNTFTRKSVPVLVAANTIYYAKIPGNSGEIYYVRIHVQYLGGTYPNRQLAIRVSLQRVSQLPYA